MNTNEVREFDFILNENEANIVLNALSKEAFYIASPIINKMQKQALEQSEPVPVEPISYIEH